MVELVTTVIITASSALLFVYWFRQACQLLFLGARNAVAPKMPDNSSPPRKPPAASTAKVTKSAVK